MQFEHDGKCSRETPNVMTWSPLFPKVNSSPGPQGRGSSEQLETYPPRLNVEEIAAHRGKAELLVLERICTSLWVSIEQGWDPGTRSAFALVSFTQKKKGKRAIARNQVFKAKNWSDSQRRVSLYGPPYLTSQEPVKSAGSHTPPSKGPPKQLCSWLWVPTHRG